MDAAGVSLGWWKSVIPCGDYSTIGTVKDLPGSRLRRVIARLGPYLRIAIDAVTSAVNP